MHWLLSAVLFLMLQSSPVPTQQTGKASTNGGSPIVSSQSAPHEPSEPRTVNIGKIPPVTVSPTKRDWVDWGYWVFSGLLVVVGGLQVWLLWRTLGAINIQADLMEQQAEAMKDTVTATRDNAVAAKDGAEAAKDNAEAAKASAEVLINTERAWVDVNIVLKPPGIYRMFVGNIGRTVAKIKEWNIGFRQYEQLGAVPEAAILFSTFDKTIQRSRLLPPSDTPWDADNFNLLSLVGEEVVKRANRKEIGLTYYGVLRYDDISDRPHETYFCYWYNSAVGHFMARQEPEYNRHT
jgi:hypothetical protein